ncbi:polyketide synthase [Apiospora arundinis]
MASTCSGYHTSRTEFHLGHQRFSGIISRCVWSTPSSLTYRLCVYAEDSVEWNHHIRAPGAEYPVFHVADSYSEIQGQDSKNGDSDQATYPQIFHVGEYLGGPLGHTAAWKAWF